MIVGTASDLRLASLTLTWFATPLGVGALDHDPSPLGLDPDSLARLLGLGQCVGSFGVRLADLFSGPRADSLHISVHLLAFGTESLPCLSGALLCVLGPAERVFGYGECNGGRGVGPVVAQRLAGVLSGESDRGRGADHQAVAARRCISRSRRAARWSARPVWSRG